MSSLSLLSPLSHSAPSAPQPHQVYNPATNPIHLSALKLLKKFESSWNQARDANLNVSRESIHTAREHHNKINQGDRGSRRSRDFDDDGSDHSDYVRRPRRNRQTTQRYDDEVLKAEEERLTRPRGTRPSMGSMSLYVKNSLRPSRKPLNPKP